MCMVTMPFHLLMIWKKAFFLKKANNPFAGKELSGVRSGHISKPYSMTAMKAKFKKRGASYNDVFMSLSSNVFAEYFEM